MRPKPLRVLILPIVAGFIPLASSHKNLAADAGPPTAKSEKSRADSTKKPPVHLSPQATQGPKPAPITPPTPEEIDAAIHRGIKFLLADQRPDGSWGSPENTKGLNIYAPPPGAHDAFKAAVTSLVVMSLI